MELVNVLFFVSWSMSLVLSFFLGLVVAPVLIAKRQKMLIEALNEAVKGLVDKVKGGEHGQA